MIEYLEASKDCVAERGWMGEWDLGLSEDLSSWSRKRAMRDVLTKEYAWAVPNEKALETLLALSPLVEIGAGGGYWAYELRKLGADIIAYDIDPEPDSNPFIAKNWTEVLKGGPEKVNGHHDRTLFLCWPYMDPMAYECLKRYRGACVAYIGESEGGCNASEPFFRRLYNKWSEVETIRIPQYWGLHDYLGIWRPAD